MELQVRRLHRSLPPGVCLVFPAAAAESAATEGPMQNDLNQVIAAGYLVGRMMEDDGVYLVEVLDAYGRPLETIPPELGAQGQRSPGQRSPGPRRRRPGG